MVKWEAKVLYLIIGAVITFIFMKGCYKPEVRYERTHSDTTIYQDRTVYVDTGKDRSFYYPADSIPYEKQLTHDDSMEITRRMYYTYYVKDSVTLTDSTGATIFRGLIEDSLFANRIWWRRFTGRIDRPFLQVNNTFDPVIDYRYLSGGISVQAATMDRANLFIDGLYQDKKGNGFSFGYGLPGKVIKIGYLRRLARF